MTRLLLLLHVLALVGCPRTPAREPAPIPAGASVAIYRDGAVVEERRWIELDAGEQLVTLDRLSDRARTASLWVRVVGAGDRVEIGRVAMRAPEGVGGHLGRRVRVDAGDAVMEGTLVEVDDELVAIEAAGRVRVVPRESVRALHVGGAGNAAGGVSFTARAREAGRYLVELAYATDGIGWTVDYGVEIDTRTGAAERGLAVAATVWNQTQLRFDEVALELRAGALDAGAAVPVWRGRGALEPGETRVPLPLVIGDDRVGFERVARVRDAPENQGAALYDVKLPLAVRRRLTIDNDAPGAVALPPGPMRVVLGGQRGPPELLHTEIDRHVEPGSEVRVDLGVDDDLVGWRRQRAHRPEAEGLLERWELFLHNRGGHALEVAVEDPIPEARRPARIERSEPEAVVRAGAVRFRLTIPGGETARGIYEVRYRAR